MPGPTIFKLTVLERYLGKMYLATTFFVSLVFVAVIGMMQMMAELSSVGSGYKLSHAFIYASSNILSYLYDLFPIISMMGAILALGHLASGNELIVMRVSGASIKKLMLSLSKMVCFVLLIMTLVGEGITPDVKFVAQKMKAEKINNGQVLSTTKGTWVKTLDGYTHFEKALSKHELVAVTNYQFNDKNQMIKAMYASYARLTDQGWGLQDVSISLLSDKGVMRDHFDHMTFDIGVSVPAMQLSRLQPDQQTLHQLYKVIQYRSSKGMGTESYEINFWQRIVQPFETFLLVCLTVPFMMGPLRSASMGMRLLLGMGVGFSFYFFGQFFVPFAMMYPIAPWVAAFLPSFLLLGIGHQLLRYMGD